MDFDTLVVMSGDYLTLTPEDSSSSGLAEYTLERWRKMNKPNADDDGPDLPTKKDYEDYVDPRRLS